MKLVIVESPYAARPGVWIKWYDRWKNRRYARKCMKDCLLRGEAPYASHLLYTQLGVLRDNIAEQRILGMKAGHSWMKRADMVVVYMDRGITKGMLYGIQEAKKAGVPVEERRIIHHLGIYTFGSIGQIIGNF